MISSTEDIDRLIPRLAKDPAEIAKLKAQLSRQKTSHTILVSDSRNLSMVPDNSVHLVLTSPPYWNLKEYNHHVGQLGHIDDYESFLQELDKVWQECFNKLVAGGRLVIVVGDVLLSRREFGRHKVVPLHADIQVRCERIGYDNLAPIFWHKISNANFEVKGNTKFLGKPYEPNGIIKHDIEYILMLRKNGGYRKPTIEQRLLSVISESDFEIWYNQIWEINGASTRSHPAPFPVELANRIINMFSFAGDTVLDPFLGSGSTMISAAQLGRNCIGVEIDQKYSELSFARLSSLNDLYSQDKLTIKLVQQSNEPPVT